jgi:ribosome maturation factor RimP
MPTLFFVGGLSVIPATLDQIQQLAQRVVESEGIELLEIEYKTGKSRRLLRIYIDKPGGVTLSDCENISQQLGTLLDVQNLLNVAYVLEVSSPGVDRPLKTDRDYQRALGRWVKVNILNSEGQVVPVAGKLAETNDERIVLEMPEGLRNIPRDSIQKAHQEIPLPVHPKKNRKKRKRVL